MQKYKINTILFLLLFLVIIFKDSVYYFIDKTTKLNNITSTVKESADTYFEEEYYKILNLYEIKESPKYEYIYSRVIYRDIYDYSNKMTILKGSNDHIKKQMAVINNEGLIGIIDKVTKNTSQVTLLTNKNIKVSVKINDVYGLLTVNNNNELVVGSITNYDKVLVGDYIYTSGIGSLPANIYIGQVKEIKTDKTGIEKFVIVDKTIDFNKVDYVAILKNAEDQNE